VKYHLQRAAAVASVTVLALGVAASPALAATHHPAKKKAAPAQTPAVIFPLLEFFQFGDEIGAPIVCGTGSSLIGSGAAYFGVAKDANGAINAINNACAVVVKYGDKFIDAGIAAGAAASAINPFVNPVIAAFGKSVSDAGTNYGTALNPIGPTIAGAGGTIDFFEGS
jgi:hypothetical protein